MARPTAQLRHIALDTEGTGLSAKVDRMVEIAALEFDYRTGEPIRFFHSRINPQRDIPYGVTRIHGITNAMVKDAPLFGEIVETLVDFIADSHLIIHNASFDLRMLKAEIARCPQWADLDFEKVPEKITDTLALSRLNKRATSHSLDAVCDRLGVDRSKRRQHGALVDCELLAEVYPRLWDEALKRR